MNQVWETLTQPALIIVYIVVIFLIMLLIVISVMLNERRFSQVTKKIVEEDKKAQEAEQEKDKKERPNSRFAMLKEYDEEKKDMPSSSFADEVTLKDICEEFRLFAAGKLGLYYDIGTIREFIAGMAVSHILILQGMSGTGKTSLAYAFGEFIGNPSVIIPVQPMWKERTDLLGYYNEFTKKFNETLLLEKMYEANRSAEIYIAVLDELNIARVEYYFAEFLSLLEIPNPDSRYLEVVSDKWEDDPEELKDGRIKLPENMWFIGTANNDDSTFAISDKVYDRAMVLDLNSKADPFQAPGCKTVPVSARRFNALVKEVLEKGDISEENLAKLGQLDDYLIEKFQITFGNRIMRQIRAYLPVYIACGGEEIDALDDILAKKVLRKLETQNAAYIRSEAEELCAYFEKLFGEDGMPRCRAYVRRIARSA